MEQIFKALLSYIFINIGSAVLSEYKITIDGEIYFFVNNDYDDDFIFLGEFVDWYNRKNPKNKIGEDLEIEKDCYVLTDINYNSIRLLPASIIGFGGFSDDFFAHEFITSDEKTKKITIK